METFEDFLETVEAGGKRDRVKAALDWVKQNYPQLGRRIGWNQPMFTDHGTFIIAFSVSKQHLAIAPEAVAITRFSDAIIKRGFTHTKELIRMKWAQDIDYDLLGKLIDYNIKEKANVTSFWRK